MKRLRGCCVRCWKGIDREVADACLSCASEFNQMTAELDEQALLTMIDFESAHSKVVGKRTDNLWFKKS